MKRYLPNLPSSQLGYKSCIRIMGETGRGGETARLEEGSCKYYHTGAPTQKYLLNTEYKVAQFRSRTPY